MSDVQQYLLKIDSDKAGAEQIAKETARSRMHDCHIMPQDSELIGR